MVPRILIALTLLQVNPAKADAAEPDLQLETGAVITASLGEVFRREIRVHAPPEYQLAHNSLPIPVRLEDGVELRKVEWSSQTGNGETLFQIHLSYQAFRSLRGPERVQLPELVLRFNHHGKSRDVTAPPEEMTLMPLIPSELPDDRVSVRSPVAPAAERVGATRLALIIATTFLALVVLYGCWLVALFPFHGRHRKPFARAWRELRKPLRKGDHEAAFRIIHRALDQTAGYPMFADRIESLLETHPALVPLREPLDHFFAASRQLFYAPANRPDQIGASGSYDVDGELQELCRLAMELEQR